MPKDEVRLHSDHLKANPRRVLGVNDGKLIHCEKHGQFYPSTENCPWCLSWAEEMEERAKKTTLKAEEPVKVERSLGQRFYEGLMDGINRPWDGVAAKDFWEEGATSCINNHGWTYFDGLYP